MLERLAARHEITALLTRPDAPRGRGQKTGAPPAKQTAERLGIRVYKGYREQNLIESKPDVVVIGNALSRGNPEVEYTLDSGLRPLGLDRPQHALERRLGRELLEVGRNEVIVDVVESFEPKGGELIEDRAFFGDRIG